MGDLRERLGLIQQQRVSYLKTCYQNVMNLSRNTKYSKTVIYRTCRQIKVMT